MSAHGIILFFKYGPSFPEELDNHGVAKREIMLHAVEDDILSRYQYGFPVDIGFIAIVGVLEEPVEKISGAILRPLAQYPGQYGDVEVNDVIYQIHEAMVPVKYNLHRENGRLREALDKIAAARNNLSRVRAGIRMNCPVIIRQRVWPYLQNGH